MTDVPELNDAEQLEPQLIPAGELVMVPLPLGIIVNKIPDPEEVPFPEKFAEK